MEARRLNFTQIGSQCGFSSLTYFGRVFKKYTGLTPSAYMAQIEAKEQK